MTWTKLQTIEFWDARIEVSGIPQSSTRIPTVPDQTTFIQQWFDWHRGYSIITNPDGTEDRRVLIGESLSQVEIGHLPRTTEEVQAGVETSLNARSSNPEQNFHDETRPRLSIENVDPEERIFDSSSTSESAFDSDPEGSQDNTTAAQHLLRELRQNLDDLRADVIELTQRIPRHRASPQVSTISSQLNSITRSLGTIRQQDNSNTQQLAAAQVMDRPDLRIPPRGEEGDDELLQRVGQLFNQRRQLLNSPESPLRNNQLAFLGVDIDRVLIVCDSRGRPAPVFGSRPLPSLLERAIALRNSIMGPQTHATQHAQSSIATPAGPSRSEQYNGGAQAQGMFPMQSATQSHIAIPDYQPVGYTGRLSENERNSSESFDTGNPRSMFDGSPFTAEPARQRTGGLRSSTGFPPGDIQHVSSQEGQPPRSSTVLPSHSHSREYWQTYAAQRRDAHRAQQRQDSSLREPEQISTELRQPRNNVQPRIHWRYPTPYGPARPSTPLTNDLDYLRSLRSRPPYFSPSNPSDSPHSESVLGRLGTSDFWSGLDQGPQVWTQNLPTEEELRRRQPPRRPQQSETRLDNDSTGSTPERSSEGLGMSDSLPHLAPGPRVESPDIPTGEEPRRRPRPRPRHQPSLDNDSTRPAAVAEQAKNMVMECKVCFEQISNQVLLPCGK